MLCQHQVACFVLFLSSSYDPQMPVATSDVYFACDTGTQYEPNLGYNTKDTARIQEVSRSSQTDITVDLDLLRPSNKQETSSSSTSYGGGGFEPMNYYKTVSCQTEHSGDFSNSAFNEISANASIVNFHSTRNSQMLCSHCGSTIQMSCQDLGASFDSETLNSGKDELDSIIVRHSMKVKQAKSIGHDSFDAMPSGAFLPKQVSLTEMNSFENVISAELENTNDEMPDTNKTTNQSPSKESDDTDCLAASIATDLFYTSEWNPDINPEEMQREISMDYLVMKAVIQKLDELLLASAYQNLE